MAESIYPSKDANFWSERLSKINRLIESTRLSSYSGKEFSGELTTLIREYKDKNYILKVDGKGNRIPWDRNLNQPWSDTAVANFIKFGELGGEPLSTGDIRLLEDLRTVIQRGGVKDQGSTVLSLINLLRGSNLEVQLPDGTETTESQLYGDDLFTTALKNLQKGLGNPESSKAVQRALSEKFPDIFTEFGILTGKTEEPVDGVIEEGDGSNVEGILEGEVWNSTDGVLDGQSQQVGRGDKGTDRWGRDFDDPNYGIPPQDAQDEIETEQQLPSNQVSSEPKSTSRWVDPPAREDQTEEFKAFLRAYPHLRNSDGKIAYETMQANKHGIIMDALTLEELGP